jgi:hypothetical protein
MTMIDGLAESDKSELIANDNWFGVITEKATTRFLLQK